MALNKINDRKVWAPVTGVQVASASGALVISSRLDQQRQLFVTSATLQYLYYPAEDGFVTIPNAALAGTFGPGTCGTGSCVGPTGTALAGGSLRNLPTNLTLARGAQGYKVQITGGPGAGDVREIAYNTVGANGVITVTADFSATPTTATTYRLLTPRWYVLNGGTLAVNSFKAYDWLLNSWITLANTGLPASLTIDSKMIATPSIGDNGVAMIFSTGLANAGSTTTTMITGKTWTVNQWSNYQVRITSGTGAGQIRSITSNTPTTLTVPAWTVTPDATSSYVIEGNDDYIYIMGNGAVTLYRYSISGNTAVTLTPTVARAAITGVGLSGHWVSSVPVGADPRWADETNIINGRRIYSFRGTSAVLDYYDIAFNLWTSGVVWSPGIETFGIGAKYVYAGDFLYIHRDITGDWRRYSFSQQSMVGWGKNVTLGGAAIVGDTAFDVVSPTGHRFVYMWLNSSTALMRCMVI